MSNANDCPPEDWEDSFTVVEPSDVYGPEGTKGMYGVMEAECATVAYTTTRRAAEVIADALNRVWTDRGPPTRDEDGKERSAMHEVLVLDGVSVGIDPDEAAEIVRACCRMEPDQTTWGARWIKVGAKRLTANVHVFLRGEADEQGTLSRASLWLKARATEARTLFAKRGNS